jgi:hypothetical protein
MSKIEDSRKNYPYFNINFIDIFRKLDITKTGKYTPLFARILSQEIESRIESMDKYNEYVVEKLNNYGFDSTDLTTLELYTIMHLIDMLGEVPVVNLIDFMDYMERGFIENKDVLTYKNIEQVRNAISVASLKEVSKNLENQIVKEFEDETWIIVRPMSFEASSKYGASTKWCTTYKREKEYFAKYFSRGVLAYFINKKTGYKFALFSEVYKGNNEISFWNAEDSRVDFLSLDVDFYLLPKIKELANSKMKNSDFVTHEEKEKIYKECSYFEFKDELGLVPVEVNNHYLQEPEVYRIGQVDVVYNNQTEMVVDDFPTPTETVARA